jgi:Endonuclease/Exonuclease/phosphatase family
MKRNLRNSASVSLLILLLLFTQVGFAQLTLTTSPYTQDFNAIGSGLPNGWSVRTAANTTTSGSSATFASAATNWNSTSGNFRNVASATGLLSTTSSIDQAASTNRALAVRQTGSLGDPGAAFVLQLANTSGLSNFSLTFKLQALDAAITRTATWVIDYGVGTSPTTFTTIATTPTVLTTSGNWGSTDVTVNFGGALDNISEPVWIRLVTLSSTTGSGSRPTTAIDDMQLAFVAGDISAPIFTASSPTIDTYTTQGFTLNMQLNESGKTYYVVLPDGATAPTPTQVKAGTDASSVNLLANFFGFATNTNASTNYTTVITGLTSDTDYDVYVVAEDNVPNLQTSPIKIDAKTNAVGDVTPPDFTASYPTVASVTPNSFVLKNNLNSLGKIYFVVLPANATAPTSAQVKEGRDANGTLLTTTLVGSLIISNVGSEFNSTIEGLTANTTYDVYVVAEDNVPNLQTSPTKLSLTTSKLFTETFDVCNGTSSFSSFSVAGDQVWGCTDFGRNSKGIRMNGFAGTSVVNEDWLISPLLTLGDNSNLSFYSQFSFAGDGLQLKISTNYDGSQNPSSATWTNLNVNFPTIAVPSNSSLLSDWTFSSVDLAAYNQQKVYVAFVYTSSATSAARWSLDEISVSNATASYMETTPSGLVFNASGDVKSYTVKGFNLQQDVFITGSSVFQLSKDNVTFSNSISLTSTEINVEKEIFVKFTIPPSEVNTLNEVLTHTSAGVATRNVLVSGTDKSQTFDIVSHNIEFFGTDVRDASNVEFGPTDDALQISNEITVMQTLSADVYATQEVSDDAAFNQLATALPGYAQILSPRWSRSFQDPDPNFPPQKLGFIYNTNTVQLVSSRVMFSKLYDDVRTGTVTLLGYPAAGSLFWGEGRLPFMITVQVTIAGKSEKIHIVNIHAKSGSAIADYNRRKYDVQVLHDSLTAQYNNARVIILGDFNDDVDSSIASGQPSSYTPFVNNNMDYSVLTFPLSQTGAATFPSFNSFLDHIVVANELSPSYVPSSTRIEDPRTYISNYSNTTSDHLPVSARFFIVGKTAQTISFNDIPAKRLTDVSFQLTDTTSASLPINYTSTSPNISISGNTVTLLATGSATIVASQAGNDIFEPAVSVERTFCVNPLNPTIATSGVGNTTLTSSANTGNQWFLNGNAIAGATASTYTATESGEYTVKQTIDGCSSELSEKIVLIVTSIEDITNSISVYPNPVDKDVLYVSGANYAKVQGVMTKEGRTLSVTVSYSSDAILVNVEKLAAGMYVLLVNVNEQLVRVRFVKE